MIEFISSDPSISSFSSSSSILSVSELIDRAAIAQNRYLQLEREHCALEMSKDYIKRVHGSSIGGVGGNSGLRSKRGGGGDSFGGSNDELEFEMIG